MWNAEDEHNKFEQQTTTNLPHWNAGMLENVQKQKSWQLNKQTGKSPAYFNANMLCSRLMHSNWKVFFVDGGEHVCVRCVCVCFLFVYSFFFIGLNRLSPAGIFYSCAFFPFFSVFENPLVVFTSKWVDIWQKQITKYEVNRNSIYRVRFSAIQYVSKLDYREIVKYSNKAIIYYAKTMITCHRLDEHGFVVRFHSNAKHKNRHNFNQTIACMYYLNKFVEDFPVPMDASFEKLAQQHFR